jgi:hypothetical protein
MTSIDESRRDPGRSLLAMGRYFLAVAVAAAEIALRVAGHRSATPLWGAAAYGLAVTLLVALGLRYPVAAFAVTAALAVPAGGAYVLLLWTAYQAGRHAMSRPGTAVVAGAALGRSEEELTALEGARVLAGPLLERAGRPAGHLAHGRQDP